MPSSSPNYDKVSQTDLEENLASAEQQERSTTFTHIPEAASLTWTDSFYDGKHGIVAVFDRAAHTAGDWMVWKLTKTALILYAFGILYFGMFLFAPLASTPNDEDNTLNAIIGVEMIVFGTIVVLIGFRSRQAMKDQHVAMTTEGVRIDSGRMVSVTIPFEHIQKTEVKEEKACCRSAGFETITIHRSVTPLEQSCCVKTKKLELHGILRPREFVALIEAMKDAEQNGTYEGLARVEMVDHSKKAETSV